MTDLITLSEELGKGRALPLRGHSGGLRPEPLRVSALRAPAVNADPRGSFECGICQREICRRWDRSGPDAQLPPICLYCERTYSDRVGKPIAGSFRDRREAVRIYAIAEALHSAAGLQKWNASHANS